jgi:hypothetical protein
MMMSNESNEKCKSCMFFVKNKLLDEEFEKARLLQIEYMGKIQKANEVIAKYTKKMDEE